MASVAPRTEAHRREGAGLVVDLAKIEQRRLRDGADTFAGSDALTRAAFGITAASRISPGSDDRQGQRRCERFAITVARSSRARAPARFGREMRHKPQLV
jgi:hypothetical protein